MAELLTMYPGQANSPETTLAGAISASSTSATVLDGSVLPAAPNYLTLGADTTAARAWDKGDTVGRYFTAADHDTLIENINRLNNGKTEKVSSAVAGDFAGLDADGNLTDSGKKAEDFAAAAHEHSGYALVKYFQNVTVAASAWVSSSTKPAYPSIHRGSRRSPSGTTTPRAVILRRVPTPAQTQSSYTPRASPRLK